MKKADILLLCSIFALALLALIPAWNASTSGKTAIVTVKGEEAARLDLSKDQTISVEGSLGPVVIEVKEGKVAVIEENSPHHYCSFQGYTDNPSTPIICLPNETMVEIEGDKGAEDVLIQ